MCTCLHNIILCITLAVLQPRRLHQQGQSKMKQTGKLSKMMISSMTSTLMLPTQSSPSNFLIELGFNILCGTNPHKSQSLPRQWREPSSFIT